MPSDAAVKGASKSTRVCVVNKDTIGNELNRVIWYRYDTNTGMKMPLGQSVCAEGGFSSQPDIEGTITLSEGTDMMNNTTEIKVSAFNPFAGKPKIQFDGPGLLRQPAFLSEGERIEVSAQAFGRQRRLLTVERLPDTQWKEFRITISAPHVCEPGGPCAVGDTGPGGGVVFYDAGSTQAWGRYLEVAPIGWSGKPDDPNVKFCASDQAGFNKELSTERAIGSGRQNTLIAARECGGTTAPSLAANYRGGGKSDWYLPAVSELGALFNRDFRGNPGLFGLALISFWSSSNSAVTPTKAMIQHIDYPDKPYSEEKNDTNAVRPIRAF